MADDDELAKMRRKIGKRMIDPYGDPTSPFSPFGKTARPVGERRRSDIGRTPVAVGPIQQALAIAGREYTRYRDRYEDEKDKGQFSNETQKRVEIYGMLARDLRTLLGMLRAETQDAFIRNSRRQQKARKVKKLNMLGRAVKMVVG